MQKNNVGSKGAAPRGMTVMTLSAGAPLPSTLRPAILCLDDSDALVAVVHDRPAAAASKPRAPRKPAEKAPAAAAAPAEVAPAEAEKVSKLAKVAKPVKEAKEAKEAKESKVAKVGLAARPEKAKKAPKAPAAETRVDTLVAAIRKLTAESRKQGGEKAGVALAQLARAFKNDGELALEDNEKLAHTLKYSRGSGDLQASFFSENGVLTAEAKLAIAQIQ